MAKKKGGSGQGKNVRRFDKNGNPYFLNRETGRRVSREKWQRERDRIARKREREQTPPPPPRTPVRHPTPGPVPPPVQPAPAPTPPPFPTGVDDTGWPLDDDGEWDLNAFAVEGEDDT